jgi:hypothetical protein
VTDEGNLAPMQQEHSSAGREHKDGQTEQQAAVTHDLDAKDGQVADNRSGHEADREDRADGCGSAPTFVKM